ncbi:MAG: nicotinate (nicotinamide) nucleotide adenylyltransferase [Candidatus Aminicenantes bacterium]|nr:nicotinate (nicotinamide) nucleotide adenylyltransferase [Candidatus Aminicenantes bacterium]
MKPGADAMPRARIGLFGGTFNPVHSGHIHAARAVRDRLEFREVLLIPSYRPPHKGTVGLAPAQDRLAMVRLAVRDCPGLAASAVEVEARETSYAVLTLDKMKAAYPGARLFFVLGTDAFAEIETWKDYRHLLEECLWVIMSRPGGARADARRVLGSRPAALCRVLTAGERLRDADLARVRFIFLDVDALDISSSAVREAVRNGRPIAGLVPPAVEDYLRSHQLYRKDNG